MSTRFGDPLPLQRTSAVSKVSIYTTKQLVTPTQSHYLQAETASHADSKPLSPGIFARDAYAHQLRKFVLKLSLLAGELIHHHAKECKARTYVYVTVGQPASLPLNVRLLKLWGGTTSEGWSFRLGATIAWIVFMCMTKFQDPTAIDTPLICVLPDGTVTLAKRC